MKTRNLVTNLAVVAALAVGVGAYSFAASAQDNPGRSSTTAETYGPNTTHNADPGYEPRGYGPGYYRHGWDGTGPGMMGYYRSGWGGMGPGMMGYGYGGGYGMMGW